MTRQKESIADRLIKAALFVMLLPIILPLVLAALTLRFLHRIGLHVLICILWLRKGKDVLIVYSDSPIWHDYFMNEIVPLARDRVVVLNWSERKKWARWSLAPHVFHALGGAREFNPLVVVFRPLRRAVVIRFWSAFKDWKRGQTEPVERLRQRLLAVL